MSWPVTTYYCTCCDFRQSNIVAWGTKEYVLADGVRIPVKGSLGWCRQCEGLAPVESLDVERQEAELNKAERKLELQRGRLVRRWWQIHRSLLPAASEYCKMDILAEEVEDEKAKLQLINTRQSPARCLNCGSVEVIAKLVTNTSEWPDERLPKHTGFTHPGCGGEILMVMDGLRIGLMPEVCRYTPEGVMLEREDVLGYTEPSPEYFEERTASNTRIRNIQGKGTP